jgi:maltose O-acetyltransferase
MQLHSYIGNIKQAFKGSALLPWPARKLILALDGSVFGRKTYVDCGLQIGGARLRLADNIYINKCLLVDGNGEIRIGSNARVGPRCQLITSVHEVTSDPSARASHDPHYRPITIGEGVWLGAAVIVLAGAAIAEGCVIAAGAVVTRDTEPNGLYGGIPARRLKDFPCG